jgi:hypothetical protein
MIHHIQEQQKNIMDLLGHKSYWFKYGKTTLAGAGTQTAALAFGGRLVLQEQQKNMTVQLGQQIHQEFKYGKI